MRALLRRSLSLRLLVIFAITGAAVLATLVLLLRGGLAAQWRLAMQPHLKRYVEYALEDLGVPPSLERARAIARAVPVEIALYRDGAFVGATDGRPIRFDRMRFRAPARRRASAAVGGADDGGADDAGAPDRADRAGVRAPDVAISGDRHGPTLRVRRDDWDVYFRLDARSRTRGYADELGLAALAIALVLLASWLAIRRELRPVGRIGAAVERMRAGDLDARTGLAGDDDLATLGASVDAMAERLRAMLDAKRELLLAVSHELRSPIARARVALELLPPGAGRERLGRDLVEMQSLVDALLEAERLAGRHAVLSLAALDLGALVRDVTAGVADASGAAVEVRLPDAPLPLLGDEARLRVLARNLVENATLHGRGPAGAARVTVEASGDASALTLRVADEGPGIAPDRREGVTEPFERLDASRSRRTGGVGLGLALARRIAEAHGGTLALGDARPGAGAPGLAVTVRLPRDPGRTAPAGTGTVRVDPGRTDPDRADPDRMDPAGAPT